MKLALYPLFLKLQGRTCIVVGGNDLAEEKIRGLLDVGAILLLHDGPYGIVGQPIRKHAEEPIDPVIWNIEPCDFGPPPK